MRKMMSLATSVVAMASMVMFTACGNTDVYEGPVKEKTYSEKFVEKFGPVSSDQSWDFTVNAKAGTRAAAGDDAPVLIEQFVDGQYGLEWKWKDSKNEKKLNQNALNKIYNSDLEDIKAAVADDVNNKPQPWDLSQYSSILFRIFATSPCDNTKTYMRIGLHLDAEKNWWVSQTNPKLKWHKGTNYMDHPRYMDLTQLPEDAFWFAIAQTHEEAKTNKQGAKVKASEYGLKKFKEVVVNGNTFWAFDCNGDGDFADVIWWVEATKKPATVVSEVSKRYMMEDLGSIGDFDFNDCVVDLTKTTWSDGKVEATGVVRALGGIMDISILIGGQKVWNKAAQEGIDVETMYNTTNIDKNASYGTFDASGWIPEDNNISFKVKANSSQTINQEVEVVFPKTGEIPQMVAVRADHDWRTEKNGVPSIEWFK